MEKSKEYKWKFSARIIRRALEACEASLDNKTKSTTTYSVSRGSERWNFDDLEECLNAYADHNTEYSRIAFYWNEERAKFAVSLLLSQTNIEVESKSRSTIEKVFSVFEEAGAEDRTPLSVTRKQRPTIFIGHGRSNLWEKLKTHLQDKHGLDVVSYETGARAGHTIRDILDDMADESSIALLVLTGEDKTESGIRARQNVIHECGLFQGRLGFDRAIMIVEEGIELASNFDGIQQLRFKRGRISEVFGDVLATIKREFGPI